CSSPNLSLSFFFINDMSAIFPYILSLHDALPISSRDMFPIILRYIHRPVKLLCDEMYLVCPVRFVFHRNRDTGFHQGIRRVILRSEEHTSELQSRFELLCRLMSEKNNYIQKKG